MEYITLIFGLLISLAQTGLGLFFLFSIQRVFGKSGLGTSPVSWAWVPPLWVLGLLLHLSLFLLLSALGLSWWMAALIPLIPGLLGLWRSSRQLPEIERWNGWWALFLLWLLVHVGLGLSLFTLDNGISTPWMNNYGDLAFHLGMIRHFTEAQLLPGNYHIFAGQALSYPFFVNAWSALLWWPDLRWEGLHKVFVLQWVLLWAFVYWALFTRRAPYLPWLVLVGGGSLLAVFAEGDHYSWQLINEGWPFTTWLSTIWVTQRSALLGLAGALAVVSFIAREEFQGESLAGRAVLAGLCLGALPLAHTHFFLFTALFVGGWWSIRALDQARTEEGPIFRRLVTAVHSTGLSYLILASLIALPVFPLLLGKSDMMGWMPGWQIGSPQSPGRSAWMWITNAAPWLLMLLGLILWRVTRTAGFVLILLFALGNLVLLASWEWDQLKVFLAIFCLRLWVWRFGATQEKLMRSRWVVGAALAVFLAIPGVVEWARIIAEGPSYQIYSPQKLALAKLVRDKVPPGNVIAAATDHNGAATLSGRPLFYGYPGTLSSHAIPYRVREPVQSNLNKLAKCNKSPLRSVWCPQYLVWDADASRQWQQDQPPPEFERWMSLDNRTGIYRLRHVEIGEFR